MTTYDRLRAGDRVKIVANPDTRKYGVTCHNHFGNRADNVLWAGEVGTVTRVPYRAWNDEPMAIWTIDFDRGRQVTLSVPEDVDTATATEACFLLESEAEPFRRTK